MYFLFFSLFLRLHFYPSAFYISQQPLHSISFKDSATFGNEMKILSTPNVIDKFLLYSDEMFFKKNTHPGI